LRREELRGDCGEIWVARWWRLHGILWPAWRLAGSVRVRCFALKVVGGVWGDGSSLEERLLPLKALSDIRAER
jgi:hypothetical protein